ncbi:protein translocase subunit SecF [bacterium]|jgi:preprotein translocase subunit SecF|nr:protein translocase subunit SecF [bacterium]MBT3580675.1 protein translocase subunit SecF [bacterium]MBT4552210.1 protein translocase subunit SecF [bacterium]
MIKKYKIVEKKNFWFSMSLLFILVGLTLMSYRALTQKPILNFGIDFTGGTSISLKIEALNKNLLQYKDKGQTEDEVKIAFIEDVRNVLGEVGLEKSYIQITKDKEVLIKTTELTDDKRVEILDLLENKFGGLELLEADVVGPIIGAELKTTSLWIIFVVMVMLLLYITWRFEFVFGISALMALLHDALVIVCFAAIFNVEINVPFVAALLTVLGYSINDTIVVFDRIRENLFSAKMKSDIKNIINESLSQTMRRTIHTSVTTLLVVGCLFLFGGATIKSFTLVLLVGILSGTYSSLCIASPILAMVSDKK